MKNIKTILISLTLILILINTSCIDNTSGLSSQPGNNSHILSSSEISSQISSESSTIPDISGRGNQWVSKKLEVGFIGPGSRDLWLTMFTKNIFDTADDWNIDLEYCDGQGKQDIQIKHIENLIEKEVDAIGFIPVWESGWDEILRKVKEAKIPIILVDNSVDCADESLWTSHIVNNFYKEGQLAGEWLRDYLEKEDRLDKNIDVVQLKEHFTYLAQEERNEGFKDAINSLNNIDIIAKEIESKNVTVTKEYFIKLAEYLRNNNIDVLYTIDYFFTYEGLQKLEQAGMIPGEDILIIDIGGTNAALEAIVEGKVACSVECNPLMGDLFMEACVRLANGEEIEREIHPVDRVFDITNAQAEIDYRKLKGYGY